MDEKRFEDATRKVRGGIQEEISPYTQTINQKRKSVADIVNSDTSIDSSSRSDISLILDETTPYGDKAGKLNKYIEKYSDTNPKLSEDLLALRNAESKVKRLTSDAKTFESDVKRGYIPAKYIGKIVPKFETNMWKVTEYYQTKYPNLKKIQLSIIKDGSPMGTSSPTLAFIFISLLRRGMSCVILLQIL